MHTNIAGVLVLVAALNVSLLGQIDKARGDIYTKFNQLYRDMVSASEHKEQGAALTLQVAMMEAGNEMIRYCQPIPDKLNDANLRDLATKTKLFVDQYRNRFRSAANKLYEKLKITNENYSSELSDFKSEYSALIQDFNDAWADFSKIGQVLKATCPNDCFK